MASLVLVGCGIEGRDQPSSSSSYDANADKLRPVLVDNVDEGGQYNIKKLLSCFLIVPSNDGGRPWTYRTQPSQS